MFIVIPIEIIENNENKIEYVEDRRITWAIILIIIILKSKITLIIDYIVEVIRKIKRNKEITWLLDISVGTKKHCVEEYGSDINRESGGAVEIGEITITKFESTIEAQITNNPKNPNNETIIVTI